MFRYDFSRIPHVSMTGKVREKSGWSHNGRTMRVNLLVIFTGGECRFTIDGNEYDCRRGDIVLVPKHTRYAPRTETYCEYTFFHFDGDFVPCAPSEEALRPFHDITHTMPSYGTVPADNDLLYFDYKMVYDDAAHEMDVFLRKCADTQLQSAGKTQLLLSIRFSEMLFFLSQSFCKQFAVSDEVPLPVRRIVHYIKENYAHPITLDDICRNVNLSKQYTMRMFKKYMKLTINDYILELRMRHAAYLLRSTYMNISQTADYLGFSNANYFSSVFKKYYGVSPSEYVEK